MKVQLLRITALAAILLSPALTAHGQQDVEFDEVTIPKPQVMEVGYAAKDSDCYACGEDDCGCGLGLGLGRGLIKPTKHCFSGFISPMTNPVFFEDPRIQTEAKLLFIQHRVPLAAGGGDVQLYAMQFQVALSDRLSLVADKDGFIVSQNPLLDDGWADVALGLKYNLFSDYEAQRLVSVGLSYELPVGSTRSLQGNGDGEFHLYLSGGAQLGCHSHWITGAGFRLPTDTVDESQMWYWSNHLDRQITDTTYVFGEVNWFHWMRAGEQPALAGVEGGDLFNLGSTAVAGNDIVTGAVGLKYKPDANLEVGFAVEVPLTERRDILDNRLTFDTILRY